MQMRLPRSSHIQIHDMKTLHVFHPCFPKYDNLGDIVANQSIAPMFARHGYDIQLTDDDLWERRSTRLLLDDQIDRINEEFDLVMIGPGGFLGPKMINSVFEHTHSWQQLKIPLCLNGVGIVASATKPVWYGSLSDETHLNHALRKASAISVRETTSWLLASQAIGGNANHLMLAGCPSLVTTQNTQVLKKYDLAFNWSLTHEVCKEHISKLIQVAQTIADMKIRVLCICHSMHDENLIRSLNIKLHLGFDICRPANAQQVGEAYASCRQGLVTRFHAGIYCLANKIPFGFIAYDMKCWHLMSMVTEEPYQYLLPIDTLHSMDIEKSIKKIFARLTKNQNEIEIVMTKLCRYFYDEENRFVKTCLQALK
jgi:hypothetical protein